MNNLTTRKIVLGMLLALVLAFSVQGTADAYTVKRKSSDDLEIRDIGDRDQFKVSFTVDDVDTADGSTDELVIPDFDDMTLEKIGSSTVIEGHQSGATLEAVLEDDDETYLLLKDGSYTLTYSVDSGNNVNAGAKTIEIPGGDSSNLNFTVYVVAEAARTDAEKVVIGEDSDDDEGIEYEVRGRQHDLIHVNEAPNLPVTIKVSGGGKVYVRLGDRETSETTSLTTSSSAPIYLNMKENTNTVTVTIPGLDPYTATFIYGNPRLERIGARDPKGIAGGRLAEPLGVRLVDFEDDEVSGIPVTFSGGTADQFTYVPGKSRYKDSTTNEILTATSTKPDNPAEGADIEVYTDSDGEACVYYEFASNATTSTSQEVTVEVTDTTATTKFEPEIEARDLRPTLEILSGDSQRTNDNGDLEDLLVVVVRQDGRLKPGEKVTFRTSKGTLVGYTSSSVDTYIDSRDSSDLTKDAGKRVYGGTDGSGEAEIEYYQDPGEGSDTVTAMISGTTSAGADYERQVTFTINGSGGSRPSRPSEPSEPSNAITITLSSTTGEPGDEIDVEVDSSPRGVLVTINSGELDDTDFSRLSGGTPFTSTLILPDEEDTYTFSATRSRFTSDSATVTVETEEVALGTLSIEALGDPANGQQTIRINVRDSEGVAPTVPVDVTLTGTGINRTVPTTRGSGAAVIAVPNTVSVSAEGYRLNTITLTGTGQGTGSTPTPTTPTTPTVPTVGEPDSIEITGPSTRSGTVNEELDTVLLVRVLDDDGDGIEDARVFYRVIEGRGRLSDATRSARRIGVITDEDGYARVNFTPTDGGTHKVRVNTDDISDTVTFTITTGSAPPTRTPGTGVTPGTVSPVVHVGAASRPPMLWVDGGAIYALVGASPERFAPSVDNAMNIAVSGGKVYWTEKTGESGGTINSANLNGTGVTELASIFATPIGIAVDAAGSKLYWTNSAGRIQSANLNGSGITNVMQNLDNPMDIALAGGNAYWTQGTGSVRFVNLKGQKVVRNVSTGTDTPGSLVIGGGKVYWTEMTGESGGTVNSANLNGTGAMELASILAAPIGIAVDGSRSKLYWTNARGRIQSANLDGSKIKNVVDGLGSPGELVLSNSIAAPTTTTPTTTRTPTTASKYDVNGDGSVDNADASLVAAAMNTSNTKYDVNGDGTVNFLDLLLVFDNRDDNAAAAPTIVGMQLSAAQIDRIQEQIDLLIATNDRSPAAMRTLIYLQQLIVMARPEKTQLLANYPNPFNPETWIPYELATDTHVRITIYNPQGVVIRTLQLGQQSAGYYTDRDRAAYWDGRNALGEQVASGLYFYQFETDTMSSLRKMVILK